LPVVCTKNDRNRFCNINADKIVCENTKNVDWIVGFRIGITGKKIKANYQEGLLYINIPKREEAKQKPPRQISIS